MSVVAALTGIIPPIVAGGVALKFTQAALGKQKRSSGRVKGKGKRLSNKYSPF